MNTEKRDNRAAFENLILREPARYGLSAGAIEDAVREFARQGGEISTGPGGAYTPSGQSLRSWIEDQQTTSPHWFTPPTAPTPPAPVAKPAAGTKESADSRLSRSNGHEPLRPERKSGKA